MGIKIHPDEIQDIKFEERAKNDLYWDDISELEDSLDTIIAAYQVFEDEFNSNYYHSEKIVVATRMSKIKDIVDELAEELETFRLVAEMYY